MQPYDDNDHDDATCWTFNILVVCTTQHSSSSVPHHFLQHISCNMHSIWWRRSVRAHLFTAHKMLHTGHCAGTWWGSCLKWDLL